MEQKPLKVDTRLATQILRAHFRGEERCSMKESMKKKLLSANTNIKTIQARSSQTCTSEIGIPLLFT
jgi:hypothetical protein